MLLHIDGFDAYASTTEMGNVYTLNGNLLTTGGRFGGGCFQSSNYRHSIVKTLPAPKSEVWFGFAMVSGGLGADTGIVAISSTLGMEASFSWNHTSGCFKAWRGDGENLLGTASPVSMGTAWHWVEFHFIISNGSGVIEIWVDGARVMNLTGVNNTKYNQSSFLSIGLAGDGGNTLNSAYGLYDDWYILDTTGSYNNTRLGDCRIETLRPTGDAGPNDGTPNSGSNHYSRVNEANFDGDTSYLTITNTSGQAELFNMGSLSGSPSSVLAVKVSNWVKKTDGGSCNAAAIIKSGSTTVDGGSVALVTGYAAVNGIFETDPDTSAAWTAAGVNAAKGGLKIP